jgi:hypothetical protein
MSSETSFFGEETSSLTEYHLVNPEKACSDIVNSIRRGEVTILVAKVSAGMGETSVKDATRIEEIAASFTELSRANEASLFGTGDSPQLEARGVTKHPNPLDSDDGDKKPLIVVFQQSDGNEVDSGHFFLVAK